MTRRSRKTQTPPSRSRKLNLEALEPRICLTTYTSVELLPLPEQDHYATLAYGLNDNGLVVGRSVPEQGGIQAVVWSVDPAGEVEVDPLSGGLTASEVNNVGVIAGTGTDSKATLWTGGFGSYVAHDLGTLEGFTSSIAASISEPDSNGNIWVVGHSYSTSNDPMLATLWQADTDGNVLSVTDLEPSALNSYASDVKVIGDSVFVAGSFTNSDSVTRAVIWETGFNGVVVGRTDIEITENLQPRRAHALNNDGDVVGWAGVPGVGGTASLYERDEDVITNLGTLGDPLFGSEAFGVNDNDVVVGSYKTDRDGWAAFVWENGTMHDLHDLVSDRTFLKLREAHDVNAYGEIVGRGNVKISGNFHPERGFLLRPEGGQQAPEANDDTYITPPETPLNVAAPGVLDNDTDADGDPISAIPWNGTTANGGQVDLNSDGSFTYIPDAAFTGTDTFTYTITDGNLSSDPATVSIDVSAIEPTAIYVYDIRFVQHGRKADWWQAVFEIRSDSNGNNAGDSGDAPIAGVDMTVNFAGTPFSGTTDSNGLFTTGWVKKLQSGTDYFANVIDMALTGYIWDHLLNLEDDTDGDGNVDDFFIF